ncbi:MAG: hypothetical protein SPI44_05595 [Bacilli bacterium]|nr:hypothetical protein [Bacilli bacterium]
MNIYQKIVLEILKFLEKMDNDEEFKKNCPDITAAEYLIAKANPDIKPHRLINILSGKTKRITLQELCIICYWLNIELKDLFKNID